MSKILGRSGEGVSSLFFALPPALFRFLHKSEIDVLPICSSLISLKRGARALFLFGAGFYPGFLHLQDDLVVSSNRDMETLLPLLLHTLREALHFSSCVCAKFHTS